jgi:hypothetical protein
MLASHLTLNASSTTSTIITCGGTLFAPLISIIASGLGLQSYGQIISITSTGIMTIDNGIINAPQVVSTLITIAKGGLLNAAFLSIYAPLYIGTNSAIQISGTAVTPQMYLDTPSCTGPMILVLTPGTANLIGTQYTAATNDLVDPVFSTGVADRTVFHPAMPITFSGASGPNYIYPFTINPAFSNNFYSVELTPQIQATRPIPFTAINSGTKANGSFILQLNGSISPNGTIMGPGVTGFNSFVYDVLITPQHSSIG